MVERKIGEKSDQVIQKKRNHSGDDAHQGSQQGNDSEAKSVGSRTTPRVDTRLNCRIQLVVSLICPALPD